MAVPKKRISSSKKRIRKNMWKGKGSEAALKALSLAKCLFTGNSKSFSKEHPRGNPRGFFKNIKQKVRYENETYTLLPDT